MLTPTTAAPSPAVGPTASPTVARTAAATASPTPRPAPTASPAAASERLLKVVDANAAFSKRDYATSLRLYRQAANDDRLADSQAGHSAPTGPDLRGFARFRIVLVDTIVGQEDDARTTLDEARQKDATTPFLRLGLLFWDTYGMTADLKPACGQVTQLVRLNPEPVLRSLNNWGEGYPKVEPDDICRLP